MSEKLVHGVGVYEKGEYTSRVGGMRTKEYELWKSMLQRCYSQRFQVRCSTYIGCTISEEFKYFQKFAEWCQSQAGFGVKGYSLDKDLIYKGNKQYNRDSCAFVPSEVNTLILQRNSSRGEWPIGVYLDKNSGRFRAKCSLGKTPQHIGYFSTPEEAFLCYKTAKEAYIKVVAEKYKDSIDPRVYQALMEWEIHIYD